MSLDFGYFTAAFSVIQYVFNLLIGSLGEHFNFVIYVSLIGAAVSVIFGLGVSIFRATHKSISKKGGS